MDTEKPLQDSEQDVNDCKLFYCGGGVIDAPWETLPSDRQVAQDCQIKTCDPSFPVK